MLYCWPLSFNFHRRFESSVLLAYFLSLIVSRKCPPQIEDMEKFEDDLLEMVKNIKFQKVHDEFQDSLREDIKRINNSAKALIFADKTTNLYKLEKTQCDKLLHNSITSTYKKADEKVIDDINLEAKELATSLNIEDRMECLAKQQAFITLKDHKENFKNNPTCRLINPAKSEMGLVSKQILESVIKPSVINCCIIV